MLTITHAETVAYYPEQFSEPCRIVASGWPYDCDAKRASPDHEVFTCEPHRVWWHRPPGQAHDFGATQDAVHAHLHRPECSCGWHAHGYVRMAVAIIRHRQHAGWPDAGEAWCPVWDGAEVPA